MRFLLLLVLLITSSSCTAVGAPQSGPGSIAPDERMQWWREARFGMFIHWGL